MKDIIKHITIVARLRWISMKDELLDKKNHLAARIFLFAILIFISHSIANVFYVFFTLESSTESLKGENFIHLFCFLMFIFICFLYVKTGIKKISVGMYSFLYYQPISIKKIYTFFSVSEIISGWVLILIPFFIYLRLIVDSVNNISIVIFIFFSSLFIITSILFIQFIILFFEHIFSLLTKIKSIFWYIAFVVIIGISVVFFWIRNNIEIALQTMIDIFSSIQFFRFYVFIPSEIFAEVLILFSDKNSVENYIIWFGYWLLYICFLLWISCFLLIKYFKKDQIVKIITKENNVFKSLEIRIKNIFFFQEFIYFFRTQRVIIITLCIWMFFLFISFAPKLIDMQPYFMFMFIFTVMQMNFSNNILGSMRGEILGSFVLPVKSSKILFNKNMAMAVLWLVMLLPGFLFLGYFRHQQIHYSYFLLAVAFYIFSFFFLTTIGNFLSILFPRRNSFDDIQAGLSIEGYFGVFFMTPIPLSIFIILYLIFDYYLNKPVFLFIAMFLLTFMSMAMYFKLLPIMGKLMENRREELINTLFSKRWI